MSLFEVKCPMCKGTLWVDPSTGKLVDHRSPDQPKADLSDFIKSQKNRGSELENKFLKAREEQEKRKQELDRKFKNARQHAEEEGGDEYQSPFQWD